MLLGNSQIDLRVADGGANVEYIQTTGYLNDGMGELLGKYLGSFNIIFVQFSTHSR